jgi:hypothetical protein
VSGGPEQKYSCSPVAHPSKSLYVLAKHVPGGAQQYPDQSGEEDVLNARHATDASPSRGVSGLSHHDVTAGLEHARVGGDATVHWRSQQ